MSNKLTDLEGYQKSVDDLSKELCALGIKPPACQIDDSLPTICESLLNSAWRLVQFIHCQTMGIEKGDECFTKEKEQKMMDNMQSLQTQVARLEKKLNREKDALAQTKEINRKLQEDSNNLLRDIRRYSGQVSELTSKLEQSENFYKCELNKREAESEHLRDVLRKLRGTGSYSASVVGKLATLSVSSNHNEDDKLSQMKSVLDKLTATNHELINENLVLRDVLCDLHTDLGRIIDAADSKIAGTKEEPSDEFSTGVFQLPLSQTMTKLSNLKRKRISQLNAVLSRLNYQSCHEDELSIVP